MSACIIVLLALILCAMLWPERTRELLTLAFGLAIVLGGIAGLCTLVGLVWSYIPPRDRIGDAIALGWIVSVALVMVDNARHRRRKRGVHFK